MNWTIEGIKAEVEYRRTLTAVGTRRPVLRRRRTRTRGGRVTG
ncbi:hypothetical protein [Actinokineospora sp. NPDC004072]